ncbi:hypothetical protein BaRGS_00027895 [Batillaria attramentaria]|uniref:Uncharacterized protein n=1 Tax=Batillaria attramentaria TaxID=370345 RepID=A0ABD0K149_9CAEN
MFTTPDNMRSHFVFRERERGIKCEALYCVQSRKLPTFSHATWTGGWWCEFLIPVQVIHREELVGFAGVIHRRERHTEWSTKGRDMSYYQSCREVRKVTVGDTAEQIDSCTSFCLRPSTASFFCRVGRQEVIDKHRRGKSHVIT